MGRILKCCAVVLIALAGQCSWAQTMSGTLRLIVPYVPGGSTDTLARLVAPAISSELGVAVVVENRSGANGVVGLQYVAHAKPDGMTLGMTDSAFVVSPALEHLPYDVRKDFRPVVLVASSAQVLTVNPELPVHSVGDLIALAKREPGKLSFASAGPGTAIHIAGEQLKLAAGIDILHVPYRGLGPAITDVMGRPRVDGFWWPALGQGAGRFRQVARIGNYRRTSLGHHAGRDDICRGRIPSR